MKLLHDSRIDPLQDRSTDNADIPSGSSTVLDFLDQGRSGPPAIGTKRSNAHGVTPTGVPKAIQEEPAPSASRTNPILEALFQWFDAQRVAGRTLYFLGTTYTQPRGRELTVALANEALERTWRKLLQHLAGNRRFERPWFRKIEPIMMAFVDIPGSKPKWLKPGTAPA